MEKVIRIFRSFAEGDKADFEYNQSLTPEQRLEILGELIARAHPDVTERGLERVCRVVKLQDE